MFKKLQTYFVFIGNQEPFPSDTDIVSKILKLVKVSLKDNFSNEDTSSCLFLSSVLSAVKIEEVINLENFRMMNGIIIRNATQSVWPLSNTHIQLLRIEKEGNSPSRVKILEEFQSKEIVEILQRKEVKELNMDGGVGLYAITNTMNHSCEPKRGGSIRREWK